MNKKTKLNKKTKELYELYWLAMDHLLDLDYTKMSDEERNYWERSPIKPVIIEIHAGFSLLEAYLDKDEECEIVFHGMKVGREIPGPPHYEHVLLAVEATDEYFRHLGAMVDEISQENFTKLIQSYEELRLKCEQFRAEELKSLK